MKKRIVPLLALVLSLCILIPVSVAQSAAEGAVQISVTAENGKVKIGGTSVNNGGTHSVRETESTAAIQLEAVPNNGYAFKGWRAPGGTVSDSSSAKTQLTIGSTSESVSLTATFAKTVSVTLEQPENGSISRTDTLTTLTEGSEVELKAEGANGYGLLRWIIKDSTGTDTTDYTLKPLGNTAKLTLGATDLKISAEFSTDAGSFVWDENDSSKNATAQLKDGTKKIYVVDDVKITGWNNNAKEDLVITLTPTEDPREANAPKLFFQIGNAEAGFNSSAKVEFKDAAKVSDAGKVIKNKTVTYADGYAWEELPFTITDTNNKVKNGKIVINYPSKVTVNAVNGTVKVNGSVCNSGSTLKFMTDETVSIEAVAAGEGYTFQGWTTSATLADKSQTATTLTTTAGTFSLTATFAKTVTVTLEQPENGSISRTDTLTTLTEGSEVELKAEGANGYGLLRWIIKDSTGTDTTDYTLKPLGNTAKLTLGATDLKISAEFSTDAGSFVWDENDSSKNATAQLKDGTKKIYVVDDVKITGWNNNAKEDLVITLTPTEDPREANAPKLFFQIGNAEAGFNSSAKVEFKDAAKVSDAGKVIKNKTVTYADGYAWEELPFTITDTNNKVKNGKIVINYPSKVTVNAVNGTVKVNGSVCNSGSTLKFMTDETVSIEAVAAGEGYTFQGWTTSATLADKSQTATTLTTTAGTFSLTATFAKPSDEKTYLSFKWMCDGQDLSGVEHWMLSGGFSDMPYWIYSFADEVTFNEAIENPTKRQWLGSSDEMQSGVAAGTKLLIRLKTQHTFQNDTYLLDNVDISSIPENSLLGNKRAADGNNEMCYVGLKMDGNLSVTANYHKAANVKITADVNDTAMGTVELSPVGTAGYYQEQTTLAMMAVAQDGYRFKEWQEANGTTYLSQSQKTKAMVEFVVGDKPASFTAVFEAAELESLPITVTTVPNGKATIKINGEAGIVTAKEGQKLTISITDIDEYYLFDCWEIVEKGVEGSGSLLSDTVKFDESVTLIMPGNSGGIEITAKLKDKQYGFSWNQVMLKTGNSYTRNDTLASLTVSIDGIGQEGSSGNIQKGSKIKATVALSDSSAYVMKELFVFKQGASSGKRVATLNDIECEFAIDDWGYYYTWLVLEEKTVDNTRHNIRLTEPGTGGKIQSSNQTAQPNTTITLTAAPDSGYTLKSWIVKDEQQKTISVTADKTNSNVGTFTMPKSNVTVTAEFESTSEITPTIISVALVKSADGSLVAKGVPSGDNWTITIPNTVSAETVAKIPEGLSGLNLKIVTPAGVKVKQEGGGGSYEGDWSQGNIMCDMPVNEEVSFRAIAGTATKDYTIKLIYSGSGEPTEPILSNGSATRTSKTGATVKFTSSEAGNYFYKVVDHGATAPTADEIMKSTTKGTASTGEITFTLSNLTEDARDIYIVVVNASGGKSAALKVEIPAYGSGTDTPDTGAYKISIRAPKGGTITTNRTKADASDEIIVTVTPDNGYQMVSGSLTYTLEKAGGETKTISNGRFTMPAGDVSITCKWETATTTAKGITSFSINGVAGAVNNTTNTITITLPRGTDVTKLTPVIATNGVKSLTPGNGETVNFTNAVTYTAAMEDGSSKTYTVTVYVDKGTLADQFWDKLTDFATQVPWWQYAEKQQSTSKYPKYW